MSGSADVQSLVDFIELFRAAWRDLLPDTALRGIAGALIVLAFLFLVIRMIERAYGVSGKHYASRSFWHDILFNLYGSSGLSKLIIPTTLMAVMHERLSFLDLRLVEDLPYPVRMIVWLLAADFLNYWAHRAKHHFRFLWAFHATHHSQAHLTFATFARAHPLEDIVGQLVHVLLLLTLGADPLSFFLVYLFFTLHARLVHSQIPWRFGKLSRVIVSPVFHGHHHSLDPAHHNRNFAVTFAFWDHLFGTAVPQDSPAPTRYGIPEMRSDSLLDALFGPFRLLYGYYLKPRRSP